jgi:ABC-2 type transport system ATP-binding protein
MGELEDTADHLVVIGRGRLIADVGVRELLEGGASGPRFTLRTPQPAEAMAVLAAAGAVTSSTGGDSLTVSGLPAALIGDLLAERGLRLHELAPQRVSLEEAFLELTRGEVEYAGGGR